MWPKRQERKRLQAMRWAQKQRLKAGLPLLTEAELENFKNSHSSSTPWPGASSAF